MSQESDPNTDLDVAEQKRQELLQLFPEVRTEGGKIDFDRLRQPESRSHSALAEMGAADHVLESISGHLSRRMFEHYIMAMQLGTAAQTRRRSRRS